MDRLRWIIVPAFLILAEVTVAQTAQEVPRFGGSRTSASSSAADDPAEVQRTAPMPLRGSPQATLPVQNLPQALIGEAALEAAREEGRRFIDRRYWRDWFYGN